MSVIKGRDVLMYFNYQGTDQVVACLQECTLNTVANIAETSTLNTGKWKTFKGINLEWDGTCSGLCSLDSNISVGQLRSLQFTLQAVAIKFISTDPNGLTELFSSTCIITNVTNTGNHSNPSNYTVTIKGTGDLSSELPPVIPEGCTLNWYYYVAVGGETSTGVIAELVGNTVDGVIYRDGVAYIPSGPAHDGSAPPTGKEFSIDQDTGEIGFDPLIPLATGEQIAIPYLVCEAEEPPPECSPVVIDSAILPPAYLGIPYDFSIALFGDIPFSLGPGVVKPSWMTISVVGSTIRFIGTPTGTPATGVQVTVTILNCSGANSDTYSRTIDVLAPPITYGCGDSIAVSNYTDAAYHNYGYYYLDIDTGSPTTMFINWSAYDRPNKFSIINETDSVTEATSGWVGVADYPGLWGSSLSTAITGSISFNPVAGKVYKIEVEAGNAGPDQLSDSWNIDIACS